jgi:hypothetical protein
MNSPFRDQYIQCLKEFYKTEAQSGSDVGILNTVMERQGFSRGEIAQLYIEGTMTITTPDFTPDKEILAQFHSLECACPSCAVNIDKIVDERGHVVTGEVLHEKSTKTDKTNDTARYTKKLF